MVKRFLLLVGLLMLPILPMQASRVSAAGTTSAYIRVLHAVPDAPAVEICANGAVAVATLTYPNETPYVPVGAGPLHVQVFPAGTACSSSGALIDATPTLGSGQFYTIAATGSLKTGVQPQVLQNAAVNPSGSATIRFVHFSPDAPAVVVTAQGAGKIFGPITFPNASSYLTLPAGIYNVSVALASAPDTAVVNVPALQLEAGHIYAAYAIGFASAADSMNYTADQALKPLLSDDTIPPGLQVPLAATMVPAAKIAQLRVAHASPNAPNVDVYVDGKRVFANARFSDITRYASLVSGTHHVQVFAAGADPRGKAVIDATLSLHGRQSYTVAAVGALASIRPLVLTDRNRAPMSGMARVGFVHAAPNAGAVDIAVANGPVIFSHIAFNTASKYVSVKAGTYNLVVRPAGSKTVVLRLPNVRLASGAVYSVFAEGLVGSAPRLRAVLSVDRTGGM
jgi:hypothetical protein